jgi:hypothetical protein
VPFVGAAALLLPLIGGTAHAEQDGPAPVIHPHLFATAPPGTSNPDDITVLGGRLYVTYQNDVSSTGSPAGHTSTIVAFDRWSGAEVATYSLVGRCDGLTADPTHQRIFASVNEDLNSSLYVITPASATPVAHYTYNPSPAETGSDGTNGGTDSIAIGTDGTVFVAHSNPDTSLPAPNNTAAVYTLTLSGPFADLTPFFGVNDTAAVINPGPGGAHSAPLGLTDPDSNRFIRGGEEAGTLIQDAQADSKLVLASDAESGHPELRQLNLTNAVQPSGGPATPQLDDIARVGGPGVLYAVDQHAGSIYAINTSEVAPGTFFVSQPAPKAGDLPNDPAIGVVNLHTGVVTHVDTTLKSPKGLLFIADRDPSEGGGSGDDG